MAPSPISRRGFLIGGLSTMVLAGCSAPPRASRDPSATIPAAPSPSGTPSSSRAPIPFDVRELIRRPRFYVGHRGSGDNWPEHTLAAYRNSLQAGAEAVEISVCSTSDGVLICHHDLSAERVLGVDRKIADMTWNEVSALRVDARTWLGGKTPLEPIARLEDVLRELGPDTLVFIEDKQGTNTGVLLDLLDAQARATERFVWKQWAPASQVRAAKERGYIAWGYFDVEQIDRLDEFATTFDILGMPVATPDEVIRQVVATGIPLMCWEVRFHDDVERLAGLGVTGLMCSNVRYLVDGRPADRDSFATGRRAPGDLPTAIDTLGWSAQPAFVPERAALRIERADATSYLMGSLAAPGKELGRLDMTIVWPDAVPPGGAAGAVFALTGDAPGGLGGRGDADGYQFSLHVDGMISLARFEHGVTGPDLATGAVEAPTAGEPVRIRIDMSDDRLRATVDGEEPIEAKVTMSDGRGPWIRLFKAYASNEAVEFSEVRVVSN
ncbi:glycerophosphodiester phosphodiesterase [Microbacterium sp. QXD-8]|uniref:Glycerophosphodiester phosphodiesterase n=1 Tax=Microbacterium psychrotolerans TaxID=3068321 RepID=A0ABU0YWG8_9MICO|nr:glycerophosphodiester phosphodiesterase [Microbacterium sp. QXD-8]MDQ7876673.1 glycerophosphodiester phosphodiesterase [Microbacterium sp. QXD-8]